MKVKTLWFYFTDKLGTTILHPQFIVKTINYKAILEAKKYINGDLIDIGCGRMQYKKELTPFIKKYIGVDHPRISKLYNPQNKPDILADAIHIPVKDKSFNSALLLEVLEYFSNPALVFKELARILKPNGVVIISSPFLYPQHDLPYDRARYTKTQIKEFLENSGFKIKKQFELGNFWEMWLLSLIMYLLKSLQYLLSRKNNFISIVLIIILVCIIPPIYFLSNVLVFCLRQLPNKKGINYFPINILTIAEKK